MKTRILTAIVLIAVFGLIVVFGEGDLEFLFSGGVILLAGVAAYEFMIRGHRHNKDVYWYHYLPVVLTSVLVLINVNYFRGFRFFEVLSISVLSLVIIYLILYLLDQRMHRGELGVSLISILYVSIGFIGIAFIRQLDLRLFLYLILITVLTDTFAYFIGIKFGKHKLMPKVSPKKSIEGAIGGLLFAAVFGTWFSMHFMIIDESILITFLVSVSLSIVSQTGDLIASKFKREVGIKDFSNIFPGHGGVLDRFDSVLFAGAYFMILLLVI